MNAMTLAALVALPPVGALVADTLVRRRKHRPRPKPVSRRPFQSPVYLGHDARGTLTFVKAEAQDAENRA